MPESGFISIVDDDESVRNSTTALLQSVGYDVASFESGDGFFASDAIKKTDCLILDLKMPGMSGLELQNRLNRTEIDIPVIFVTAHANAKNRRQALDAGAAEFLRKPCDPNTLITAIGSALTRRRPDDPSKPAEN